MAVSVVYIHWPERGPRILEYEESNVMFWLS